jgi:hypothetical protein
VEAKGKGKMQTYWCMKNASGGSVVSSAHTAIKRLTAETLTTPDGWSIWNADLLGRYFDCGHCQARCACKY